MVSEQRIRNFLFYLSVLVFFTGLPFILSFALGYKFDHRTMKFTQTGLISIKTHPQGANIYLDARLLKDKTPATIQELLPGSYNIKVELAGYYPWITQVNVHPRKVSRFEQIILFPLRPNMKQVNHGNIQHLFLIKGESIILMIRIMFYVSTSEGEV